MAGAGPAPLVSARVGKFAVHPTGVGRHGRRRSPILRVPLVFVLPAGLLVAGVILTPLVLVIVNSFNNWQPGYSSPFVGLENFRTLFSSPVFHSVLVNEAILLLGLPIWVLLPLLFASLIYDRVRGGVQIRTMVLFPATVSPALVGVVFELLLAPNGPLNQGLHKLGLAVLARDWLANPSLVMPVLIVVVAWWTFGTGTVIFSAGLATLPGDLMDAAAVDGVRWHQRVLYVFLPHLRRFIGMWVIVLIVTALAAMFPWIYSLTSGGPGSSSTTIDYLIYQDALTFGYYGAAAAVTVVLLGIIASLLGVGWVVIRARGRNG